MTTQKLSSNYPEFSANDLLSTQKVITLRSSPYQYDDPLSWNELDNNFELLRYSINSLVDDIQLTFDQLNFDEAIQNLSDKITILENQTLDTRVTELEGYNAGRRLDDLEGYDLANRLLAIDQAIIDGDSAVTEAFGAADLLISDRVTILEGLDLDGRIGAIETSLGDNFAEGYASLSATVASNSDLVTTQATQITEISGNLSTAQSDIATIKVDIASIETQIEGMENNSGGGGSSATLVLGEGIYHTEDMPLGRFEIQKGDSHPYLRETAPLWSSSGNYNEGDMVKVLDTRDSIDAPNGHYIYYRATVPNPNDVPGTSNEWEFAVTSYIPFYGQAGWPWNFIGTKAATVVQVHHDTDIGENIMEPGAVYDFEVSGNGVVVADYDVSKSIHWGVQSSTRKYHNGSAQCFTAVGGLHEVEPGGYNEVGLFQGECANLGSAHGTMSGVEVRCKDTDLNAYGVKTFSADTKMVAVIGRIMREHDGVRPVHSFMASSEGSIAVDSCLTINAQANRFKYGIDLSNGDFTKDGAILMPTPSESNGWKGGRILNADHWDAAPTYAPVIPTGGPRELTSQAEIEALGERNANALEQAIKDALVDPATYATEPQRYSGVIRLPAGRIYLNRRILVYFTATLGHEFPNSITIKGEGQGVTQLVWTNNSSSQGFKIDIGPFGAQMNQKVNISDMDFVMGNQGMNSSQPYGVAIPVNQSEGLLGAKGIGIEITGDRTEQSATGAHAEQTVYSKIQGQGRDPSLSIHYVTFRGWHWQYAGWNKGILIEDVQIVDVVGCCFDTCTQNGWNTSETALHITGDAKCTDYYINQCRFFGYEYGILCDGNIEGVTVQCSTWVNTFNGIYWNVQRMIGGQAEFDTDAGTYTSGSIDGTATSDIAQWPLMVATDLHMNCIKKNIYINNGWQIMIKGCSFYGIDIGQAYGVDYGFDASHHSIYVTNQSSNVIISNNVFADAVGGTDVNDGGFGPSIEIDGHFCVVDGNTFSRDGNGDEPHVLLSARASGNVIQNNTVITSLPQTWADGGVPLSVGGFNLQITDNNTGTYNGVAIHPNRKQNNF